MGLPAQAWLHLSIRPDVLLDGEQLPISRHPARILTFHDLRHNSLFPFLCLGVPQQLCQAHSRNSVDLCLFLYFRQGIMCSPHFNPFSHSRCCGPAVCGSGMTAYMQKSHWNLPWRALNYFLGVFKRHPHRPAEMQLQDSFRKPWLSAASPETRCQVPSWPQDGSLSLHQAGRKPASQTWGFLNPASVLPEAISGKRFFTKETFTKEENSRIKYSETQELEEENTISQHHVLTQPSLQQKLQQLCVDLQSGVELELPSIPASSESTFLYPFVPLKARYWCLKTRYISFII